MIYTALFIQLSLILANSDNITWNRHQSLTDQDHVKYTTLVFDTNYDDITTRKSLQQSPWYIQVTYTDGVMYSKQLDDTDISINTITIDVDELIKTLKLSPLFDGVIKLQRFSATFIESDPVRFTKGAVLCQPSPIIIWYRHRSNQDAQQHEYVTLYFEIIYDNINDKVIEWINDVYNLLKYNTMQYVSEGGGDGKYLTVTLNVNQINYVDGMFQFGFKTEYNMVFMSPPIQFVEGHVLCTPHPVITLSNEFSKRNAKGHYIELSFEINYDGLSVQDLDFKVIIFDESNGQIQLLPHPVDINRPNFVNIALEPFKRNKLSGSLALQLVANRSDITVESKAVLFVKGIAGDVHVQHHDTIPHKIIAVLVIACISVGGLLIAVMEIPSSRKHDKEMIEVNL